MPRSKTPTIFVVSDGRGDTCAQLVSAAIVQFEGQHYSVVRRGQVRTPQRVQAIVRRAARSRAVIFYTLVGHETREAMKAAAARLGIPVVDVLGPAFSALHDLFKAAPRSRPGLLYSSERERFDRHDAIDYTLKHDDGLHPEGLAEADVVLIGLSRTSKTSTCFYLAYEGIKAANVPIVPGMAPAPELVSLASDRVIGLHMNASRIATVREARAHMLGRAPLASYLDERAIRREVQSARRLMDEHDWRSFDASYMAVEEIAREVMALRGLKGRRQP
jgi:[pyruvate, water dikinase]-phosphate phosphotransferase / [pyruvate, water dikinase] kinase